MKRSVLGIVVGYISWTILWLGGNALFFGRATELTDRGQDVTDPNTLGGLVVLSVVCSIVAGLFAAHIASDYHYRTVLILGALLLGTGIIVQSAIWSLMPVWYHLTFLGLLIPACAGGASIALRGVVSNGE